MILILIRTCNRRAPGADCPPPRYPVPVTTTGFTRKDGRATDELRPVTITRRWLDHAEGSVLISFGRTHEISRLIGRSLRGIIDVGALGENTIALDCDVLQADGGTRTAAITGAYIALTDAVAWGTERGLIKPRAGLPVLADSLSAISVGIIDGVPCLDLPYEEDVRAQTDMNVVQTGDGRFIEVQGTAEHAPFDRDELGALLDLASAGNAELAALQHRALAERADGPVTVSSAAGARA